MEEARLRRLLDRVAGGKLGGRRGARTPQGASLRGSRIREGGSPSRDPAGIPRGDLLRGENRRRDREDREERDRPGVEPARDALRARSCSGRSPRPCPAPSTIEEGRLFAIERVKAKRRGLVAVVSGGTSDRPVAEEAALTAQYLGCAVDRLYDVGVAGIHRLLSSWERIRAADCIIVVAGMEGALASVVAGIADAPLIAVPTSVGYGASFGGLAALLTMLNSCAGGVTVVNIDNGFGAGYAAATIIRRASAGDRRSGENERCEGGLGRRRAAGRAAGAHIKEEGVAVRSGSKQAPGIIVVDAAGGLSGDMFLAGLFALGADPKRVAREVRKLPGLEPFSISGRAGEPRGNRGDAREGPLPGACPRSATSPPSSP